jgi:hypothetical protein
LHYDELWHENWDGMDLRLLGRIMIVFDFIQISSQTVFIESTCTSCSASRLHLIAEQDDRHLDLISLTIHSIFKPWRLHASSNRYSFSIAARKISPSSFHPSRPHRKQSPTHTYPTTQRRYPQAAALTAHKWIDFSRTARFRQAMHVAVHNPGAWLRKRCYRAAGVCRVVGVCRVIKC